jgi:phage I-like protein
LAQALADGLISPAEVPWAQDLIAQNAASFAALCAVRSPIVALGTAQTGGQKPAGAPDAPTALSADDAKVAQMLGQTPEKFAQHKKGC